MARATSQQSAVMRVAACAAVFVGVATQPASAESKALEKIERYCTTSWRNARIDINEWSECTQEAMSRLLEKIGREKLLTAIDDRESEERRSLNRAIWSTVQKWRRSPRLSPIDQASVEISSSYHQRLDNRELLDSLFDKISDRQREILLLWADGWSVSEISEKIGIASHRVSDEKYKAIQILRENYQRAA